MVAAANGVVDFDNQTEASTHHPLLTKFVCLNDVETTTLADVCERLWRGHQSSLLQIWRNSR
jgi:hypothetical protein